MKKLIIIALVALFSAISVSSQVSVFTKFSDNGTTTPCATIFGTKKLADKTSFTYFALVTDGWAEAMLGASYAPEAWVSLGLNCGLEQQPEHMSFRAGGSLWLGKGSMSLVALVEKGEGSENYWYKTTAAYSLSKSISIGARAWRFTGFGPLFEYKTGKMISKIWVMPAHNFENNMNNLVVGIDIKI